MREQFYAENQEEFYQLTANFSNDRSDDGLTNLIFLFMNLPKPILIQRRGLMA